MQHTNYFSCRKAISSTSDFKRKKHRFYVILSALHGWIFTWTLSCITLTILAKTPRKFDKYFPFAKSNLRENSITHLTLSWRRPLSYRNQSIDLLCKSMDWFLYDNGLRHERVRHFSTFLWFVFIEKWLDRE